MFVAGAKTAIYEWVLLLDDVPIVLDIVSQFMFLNGLETCASQILSSFFFPPHRPQAFTALRQGYGHAVQARHGVKEGTQRMINVFVHLARPFDVLHQVYSAISQRSIDTFKYIQRFGLIVDCVKSRYQIERFLLGFLMKLTQIRDDKLHVAKFLLSRFLPRDEDSSPERSIPVKRLFG